MPVTDHTFFTMGAHQEPQHLAYIRMHQYDPFLIQVKHSFDAPRMTLMMMMVYCDD